MTDFALPLDFDRPIYLWAAALLPWFWWRGRRALVGLGRFRASLALLVRAAVWLLLVAACAEMQWVRTDDRLTVIYPLSDLTGVRRGHVAAAIARARESW